MKQSTLGAVLAAILLSSCSRRPSDEIISAQIRAKFFSDADVKIQPLAVDVKRGRVTLSGNVMNTEIELKALQIATNTDGVLAVDDELRILAEPTPPRPQGQIGGEPSPVTKAPGPSLSSEAAGSFPVAGTEPPGPGQDVEEASAPSEAEDLRGPDGEAMERDPEPVPDDAQPPAPGTEQPVQEVTRVVPVSVRQGPSLVRARARPPLTLNGAGSGSLAPLADNWMPEFAAATGIAFRYQSIGSAAGLRRLAEGHADFGATDLLVPEVDKAFYFPATVAAVQVICNVPLSNGNHRRGLKFDGSTLAAIYLGRITRWDDPALVTLNRDVQLPNSQITVIHRSDRAGSSEVFSQYLSRASPEWRAQAGIDASTHWSVGMAVRGDDGVEDAVLHAPGAIGYVSRNQFKPSYSHVTYGRVRNHNGVFVMADTNSITQAVADAAKSMPSDLRMSLVDAQGSGSYPMTAITWVVVPKRFGNSDKRDAAASFLKWMLNEGQSTAARLGYVPLPKDLIDRELKQVRQLW